MGRVVELGGSFGRKAFQRLPMTSLPQLDLHLPAAPSARKALAEEPTVPVVQSPLNTATRWNQAVWFKTPTCYGGAFPTGNFKKYGLYFRS